MKEKKVPNSFFFHFFSTAAIFNVNPGSQCIEKVIPEDNFAYRMNTYFFDPPNHTEVSEIVLY